MCPGSREKSGLFPSFPEKIDSPRLEGKESREKCLFFFSVLSLKNVPRAYRLRSFVSALSVVFEVYRTW